MKSAVGIFIIILMMIGSTRSQNTSNPLLQEWKTPFQVPPFDQIRNADYEPAIQEGIRVHQAEIDAIIANPAIPTFDNTILAIDQSGELLDRVSSVFYALNSANTNPEMMEIARMLSPIVTRHSDDINLNPELYKKIRTIYEQREALGLDPDQKRTVEELYKGFIRGGAGLDEPQKERLRQVNKEINLLQLSFGQNLLAETNAFKLIIDNPSDLAGLPKGIIATAAKVANADAATKGKWVFTLQNPSIMPFLQFSEKRDLRKKMLDAYMNRGNNNNKQDNKETISQLVKLRQEKGKLLGYPTWADFVLADRMALTPANVYHLLNQVWEPASKMAREEEVVLQSLLAKDYPGTILEPYDWRFYSEKVMKQNYDLNEEVVKPYLQLENVRKGVFYVANQLYGITFTEVKDAPVYYPGVTLWECKEGDGTHLGVLYLDFHPRAGKKGGAWCGAYRTQSYKNGKRVAPAMTIVTNFSAPAGNQPSLLTQDEAETFFHEFGHALAGLLRNAKYDAIASFPRDFVELPSQIMEHWAFQPEVLKIYAKHYQTGQVIPDDLTTKIEKSSKYGQGFKTTEYLAASFLDMDYHTLQNADGVNVTEFEKNAMNRIGLIAQIVPRYRSTYFQHSMTGGYTAGYYSYIWAEVLDADAFQAFLETGNLFDKNTATRFRKSILEKGGSKEAMKLYVDFRGKEPGIGPLLENRGLKK